MATVNQEGYYRLPLDEINYAVYLREEEIAPSREFPPNRFRERDRYLQLFYEMWRGDLRQFVSQERRRDGLITMNYLRRFTSFVSQALLTSEPQVTGAEEIDVREALADAVEDAIRYGRAYLSWMPSEGVLGTIDPRMVYPLSEEAGYAIASSYVSDVAPSSQPDMLDMTLARADGSAETVTYSWQGASSTGTYNSYNLSGGSPHGTLSEPQETRPEPDTLIAPVDMAPKRVGWGTSAYEDMLPLVLEVQRRLTHTSGILDANAQPPLIVKATKSALQRNFPVSPLIMNPTDAQREAAVREGLDAWRRSEIVELPDESWDVFYLTNDTDIASSHEQIDLVKRMLEFHMGIPAVLEMDEGTPPSGAALRTMMVAQYSMQKALMQDIVAAVNELIEPAVLEWPHPLDVEEGKDEMPDDEPDEDENPEPSSEFEDNPTEGGVGDESEA